MDLTEKALGCEYRGEKYQNLIKNNEVEQIWNEEYKLSWVICKDYKPVNEQWQATILLNLTIKENLVYTIFSWIQNLGEH